MGLRSLGHGKRRSGGADSPARRTATEVPNLEGAHEIGTAEISDLVEEPEDLLDLLFSDHPEHQGA